jgi:hypothetical protein
MNRGLPYSKEKLISMTLGVCYPLNSSDLAYFSCEKTPTMGPTFNDVPVY